MDVILVAFGPRAATQQAVRRLRRVPVVDTVWAVAANQRSLPAVQGIASATVVDGTGSTAVRSVARTLGDQHVLLIHDDVSITPKGVSAMLAVADGGADLVAPHSNEVGTPQFIGPLPSATDAATTLDRLTNLGEAGRIPAVRHSCMLGSGRTLAGLGGTLVVPGGSVMRPQLQITLAPIAVAHDLSCHGRLMAETAGNPTLVASMIVRDEEDQIAGALESVLGLVDRIDVCDTGSTDATVEIATSMGANVRRIEWRNDFGWARNQALEMSRDADFFLHLDADERIVVDDAPVFRRWLKTWRSELDGVLIELHNHRGAGQSWSSHRAMRIARTRGATWSGALHESVRFDTGADDCSIVFYEGIRIDHYGYSEDIVNTKGKATRNIDISRTAFEDERSVKTIVDYARSLRMADQSDELSQQLFREALVESTPQTPVTVRSYLLAVVAAADMKAGAVDRAMDLASQAVELTPREDVALNTLAHGFAARGDWEAIVGLRDHVASSPSAAPMFVVEANLARFDAYVGRAFAELGRIDDAIESLVEALEADCHASAENSCEALPRVLAAGAAPEQIARLLTADDTGAVITALAATAKPLLTATAALVALGNGATAPGLFTTGLAASLIRPVAGLTEQFLPYADQATAQQRQGLADMAKRRGRDDLAEELVPATGGWNLTLTG